MYAPYAETRSWDDARAITLSLRSKEHAHDCRYLPEPDLVPIITEQAKIEAIADYKAGKEKALGFLVGQIMKQTKGRANPELVNKLLRDRIQ